MTINSLTAATREQVDSFLKQALAQLTLNPRLNQAMQHGVLMGGKRIRPYLLMTVADICGANKNDALQAAAAVELIHAYSLIHDDLPAMDDDDLRRGQPTCHIAYDEATAILAGDALQTLAFEVLTENRMEQLPSERQLQLVQVLAKASGARGMCAGQAIDLQATAKIVTEDALEQMHLSKTGALITAAATMGVLCGNDNAQQWREKFAQFAHYLGLAFQVQDDILDVTGNTEALGKPQGSDTASEKSTYVRLLGIEGAQQRLQNLHHKALQSLSDIPYNTDRLEQFSDLLLKRDH
ncbi:polyprenyl synthetase family protein [Idiomarina loihiensis]|uniref:polyprenyl synthetase family protein n=1 Tax=Idiomarina loihiensis TaxID=135577 RepID=UPI00130C1D04|nr:farnesyl diphosphate synthase [Idiomarina loihiensis]MRJ44905.1 geranyl transferase [Idiomarina loihiensis]UTW33141.1 polyprenyl synthetase family protein [Idiomarina loihiensis]